MNPFASRHIRPGAQAFQFPPGITAETLVAQLAEQNWWGQILGPHGCGKSTLLATLHPVIEDAGREVMLFALKADQVFPPQEPRQHPWGPQTQILVDGFEQLTWWQRFRLRSTCRRRRAGLLITTHRSQGLPTLFTPAPTLELAWEIVQRMQRQAPEPHVTHEDVLHCFTQNNADLRETLFALYDVYEQRATQLHQPESSD